MTPTPDKADARAKAFIRHRQAFKLALSMTLFYWLALYMNWPLTHYGAFAIAIISLGSAEASIEKGLMRFLGTIAGVLIGFALLGLFNSTPWVMIAALSVHLWIIGTVMKASRYPYTWFMVAFVPLVVWGDTYPHFENAFYFGTFRWLETTAGIVIFSIVDLVFWPEAEETSTSAENVAATSRNYDSDASTNTALKRLGNSTNLVEALFPPLVFIVAFVTWYVVYLPPGAKVPMLAGILALVFLRESAAPPLKIWPAVAAMILFVVAPICWLVMPRLSTGIELLTLVFVYTFVVVELSGSLPPLKVLLLYLFAVMSGISNQQFYSFQVPVDGALLFLLVGIIISVVYYLFLPVLPKSPVATPSNVTGPPQA